MNKFGKAFDLLDEWIMQNGWEGYDPYDIKGTRILLPFQKNKYTRLGLELGLAISPLSMRRIFRVKKQINAKAMALFARGYQKAYEKTKREAYQEKVNDCLRILFAEASFAWKGISWGYPFNWQSKIHIPKDTPSGVVTSVAAHAYLDTHDMDIRDCRMVIKWCCDFLLKGLNRTKGCFSYTPLDNFCIHNANLFSASTLLQAYELLKKEEYKEVAVESIKFTIDHQNQDGSWYYWDHPSPIDNYHTGFLLECLNTGRKVLGNEFFYERELIKGIEYYLKNLFTREHVPKLTNSRVYPIDIHSCATSIITLCELSDFEPECFSLAKKVANWTIENMQDRKGYFYYRKYNHFTDKKPYIRWGQAWMLLALSYLINGVENKYGK